MMLLLLTAYFTQNSFPKPLSESEEKRYMSFWEAGDEKAKLKLIEHNLRLVAHIVKKFDNINNDSDDLISIGTVGLIKAVSTFNSTRKIRLATYAARCIENEILMHLRSTKRIRSEVSLYDPIGVDKEGNEISLQDILGTDEDIVADTVHTQCENERIVKELSELDEREKMIVSLRFGIGGSARHTQRDIAERLGISRSYVSRIEKKAVDKIASRLYGGEKKPKNHTE
jgi:RNA polymerase sporulation-specific sigma factor